MVEIRMHYQAAADVQNSKVIDFLVTFMALGGSGLGPLVTFSISFGSSFLYMYVL